MTRVNIGYLWVFLILIMLYSGCDLFFVAVKAEYSQEVSLARATIKVNEPVVDIEAATKLPAMKPGYIYSNITPSYYRDGCLYSHIGIDGEPIILINNMSAINPTYYQLIEFLRDDPTDLIPYSNTSFVCAEYSELLHNKAELNGINAGWVVVDFGKPPLHTMNVFNTTDRGKVYIDCTNGNMDGSYAPSWDTMVDVAVGKTYITKSLYTDSVFQPLGNITWVWECW